MTPSQQPDGPPHPDPTDGYGKAKGLQRLSECGLRVPPYVFLPPEQLRAMGVEESDAKLEESVRQLIDREPLGPSVAVRSCAFGEDGSDQSFAGHFLTVLGLAGAQDIATGIGKCWKSQFRHHGRDDSAPIDFGIIVQQQLHPTVAGIAFSRSPNKVDDLAVQIEAGYGQGAGIVDNRVPIDRYAVDRETKKYTSEIGTKNLSLKAESGQLVPERIESTIASAPSLNSAQIQEIARVALLLEKQYGRGVDIEWALSDGVIYFLQCRPITTLPPGSPETSGTYLWDNANIVESYSGVTLPLTFSFASMSYRHVYMQFARMIGVPKRVIQQEECTFASMLGHIHGRVYYNLLSWYRALSLLPNASRNESLMEEMMGVKRQLRREDQQLLEFSPAPRNSLLRSVMLQSQMLFGFLTMRRRVATFCREVDDYCEHMQSQNFAKQAPGRNLEHFYHLKEILVSKWGTPILNDIRCMIFSGVFKKLYQKWEGAEQFLRVQDQLYQSSSLFSMAPVQRLRSIAADLTSHRIAGAQLFASKASDAELWQQITQDGTLRSCRSAIDGFLREFGYRCPHELKLETVDYRMDPAPVIGLIRTQLHSQQTETSCENQQKIYAKTGAVKRCVLRFFQRMATKAIEDRETLRYRRTMCFAIVRRLFLGIGDHFSRIGVLSDPRDVFHLTVDEVLGTASGQMSSDLARLVDQRRQQFTDYDTRGFSLERFVTRGPPHLSEKYPSLLEPLADDNATATQEGVARGIACSPGVGEGEVVVAKSPQDLTDAKGKIICTVSTDPGWIPFYPQCRGLVIERGSLLSHSAIVAREMGIPTVVGVTGITQTLKTDQRVRVDGSRGTVEVIKDEQDAAHS